MLLQAERKRVAKPSGNVKQLLMKKTGQKKKEVGVVCGCGYAIVF